MSLTTEEQQLVLRVLGSADVERLTKLLEVQESTLVELAAAKAKGLVTDQAYEAQVRRTADGIARAAVELKKAEQASGGAAARVAGLNGTIRNLGYGVSDVFSNNGPLGQKIQGFANNVGNISTGILQMLGKTGPQAMAAAAGLEIAFTGVGAALTALGIKSTEDFFRLFTGAVKEADNSLKGLKERIGELEDKPHLIPVETLELENAKKLVDEITAGLKANERLRKSAGHYEKESGKAVESIADEGTVDDRGQRATGEDVQETLRRNMANRFVAGNGPLKAARDAIPALEAEVAAAKKFAESASGDDITTANAQYVDALNRLTKTRKEAADLEEASKKAAEVELGKILDRAKNDTGARLQRAQQKYAELLEQAGFSGLAGGVRAAAPEQLMANDLADEKLEESIEAQKRGIKARDAADEKVKKLNDQAQENQRKAFEERDRQRAAAAKGAADVADKNRGERGRRFNAGVNDAVKGAGETSLDEEATGVAAQLAANGGVVDPETGRRQKMDETQQFITLANMIKRALAQRNPRMDPTTRDAVASKMALAATDRAQSGFEAERAALVEQLQHQASATGQSIPQLIGAGNRAQANQMINMQATQNLMDGLGNLLARVQAVEGAAVRQNQQAANLRARAAAPRAPR